MKKKLLSKLLVFAMTVSLFSGVSQPVVMAEGTGDASGATATISGTLYDAEGNPLSGKTVTLRERSKNVDDGGGRYTVTTNGEGKYTANVAEGIYQVLGFPFAYDSAKDKGTADYTQVCAVAQIVTADDGTQVKQDLQAPTAIQIPNGEFDTKGTGDRDVANWTFGTNITKRNEKGKHSGTYRLDNWSENAYTFDVYQELTGLEKGTYVVQLSAEAGVDDMDESYVYVKNTNGNILAKEEIRITPASTYEVYGLTVEITGDPVIVGIYGKCSAKKWVSIDEFRMGKLPDKPVTKDELKTLLDKADTYTADGYTKASFEALTTAKTNAQTIYNKTDAASEEIATAYNELQAAIDGLIPAKTEGAPDIQNNTFWRDADGNIIYSQGGGIFKFGDTYYWYGVKYEEAEKYAKNPEKGPYSTNPSPKFLSVTCYSSKNLVDWKFENDVVTREEVSDREEMNDQEVAWVGRLGVAKVGEKYALMVQHECPDADNSLDGNIDTDNFSKQVLVLTSDSPTGDFTWNQRINMKDYTGGTSNTGDQTVFTDEDGTSYLVYSYGSGRGKIFLSKIVAQDGGKIGLAPSHMIYNGAGREGNCMFKYNGKYYVCASDLYGWNASHAYYMVLDSLTDDYLDSFTVEKNMKLMDGGNDDFCHVTQTGFFYTVKGSAKETVIFCGDRWADFAGNGLGYNQWCPLSFDADGTPYFNSLSAWNIDAATGEWTVHESNNYVKNGSFDADRVAVKELTGWKNTVNAGNSPINNNSNSEADKASVTGKYSLKLGDSVDFDCKVSQNIASTDAVVLPDGNYNLTVKMKNNGTFDELSMYAKSGNLTKKIAMGNHISYNDVTLSDISVTGGKVEVGFIAKGKAKASAFIDDLTLVRSSEQSADVGSIAVPITSDVEKNVVIMATSDDGTSYVYEDKLEKGTNTFTMNPIKAGVYGILVSVNSSEIQGASQSVTVEANKTSTAQAVTVTNKGGNVTGKVVDKDGAGIAGVTVTLTKGTEVITVKTGNDGTYTISDILAGTYTVQIAKEGYISPDSAEVTVEVGKTATVADQSMENAMGVIAGTVKDQSGSPVGNATVTLRGCKTKNSERRYTVKTDAEGNYSAQVIEDTYQVLAAKEGVNVQAVSEKITVERKKSYTADLTIPEAITVPNGDFEKAFYDPSKDTGDKSWTNTGTRGKHTTRSADVLSGKGGYNIWDQTASFTVELNQTLTGLKNGTYVVNVRADSGFAVDDELYVYAKDAQGTLLGKEDIPNISVNKKGEVIGLIAEVTDGTLTIGLSGNMTGAKLSSGAWSHVDDFCVGLVEADNDDTDPVVTNVINLINAIGTVEATDGCKAKIEAAEKAYAALTPAQQALVTNYSDLRDKREAYDELTKEPSQAEKDQAAAQKVIDLITEIGEVDDSEECGTKIAKAEAAYAALTDARKALVTNYSELTTKRAAYNELIKNLSQEEKDQREANAVISMINDIGTVEATEECKAKIEAAEAAYKTLTDAQKALVTNYGELTAKRAEYDEMTGPSQEEKDQAAADAVIEMIKNLGTIDASAASKTKLDAVKAAYNALTEAQKKLVTNYNDLTAAEETYKKLADAAAAKTNISKATVGAVPSQSYTGKAITPAVTVSYNGKTLVNGTDYTLGYANNTNIGTAFITITGAGNYTGTVTKTFEITVSNGKVYTVGSYKYKITSAKVDGKGTVAVTGGTKKTMKSVKIAATVNIGGKSFQITSIDKKAFKGYGKLTSVTIGKNVKTIGNNAFEKCKKLKKIKISSTVLKKVGKSAIKGIYKKATIQCPKKQLSKYKKLFKSSTGYKKTMKIKK